VYESTFTRTYQHRSLKHRSNTVLIYSNVNHVNKYLRTHCAGERWIG